MTARKRDKKKNSSDKKKLLVNGRFTAATGGFGFVTPDEGEAYTENDVFIPAKYTHNALDGDTVQVEISGKDFFDGVPGRGPSGRIIEILERKRKFVVASIGKRHTAEPLSKRLPPITVSGGTRNAKEGEWVRLRLLENGSKHTEKLRGSIEETLGRAGDLVSDVRAVVSEFGLNNSYSEKDALAAESIVPAEIKREDLTSLTTVTIDPDDAHDFDDALSYSEGKNKAEATVGVHISDVAAFIKSGSKWDKAAHERGFSSYVPGLFEPMLPKTLTHKISLREGVDSRAHTILFTVRKSDGKILSFRRVHSLIRTDARLTFSQVGAFMSDGKTDGLKPKVAEALSGLVAIYRKMHVLRMNEEHFFEISSPETVPVLNEDMTKVIDVKRRTETEADHLVEEFMLAANTAVGREIAQGGRAAGIFRVHPEPDPGKMEEFAFFCSKTFGIDAHRIFISREECVKFIKNLPDDHRKSVIISSFLRSLPRATYAAAPGFHYGLGKEIYLHFTSPIRRYPDLTVHQQLWALDTNTRLRAGKTLEKISLECSDMEETVDNAFFAACDRLKLHYLKDSGALEKMTVYEAVISRVTSGGLVCTIETLGMNGFVPRSALRGNFRRQAGTGKLSARQGHGSYKSGDFIYLVLDSLDMVRGTAVFRPA